MRRLRARAAGATKTLASKTRAARRTTPRIRLAATTGRGAAAGRRRHPAAIARDARINRRSPTPTSRWRCCARSNAGAGHDAHRSSDLLSAASRSPPCSPCGRRRGLRGDDAVALTQALAIRDHRDRCSSAAYTLYLLSRSNERTGRIATVARVVRCHDRLAAVFAEFVAAVPDLSGRLDLVRSARCTSTSSTITALVDLGSSALALASRFGPRRVRSSLSLAIWCFFLVQALFVALPADVAAKARTRRRPDQPFQRAQRSADAASPSRRRPSAFPTSSITTRVRVIR